MQRIALVVDDSRVARMTLKKLLKTYQVDVIELGSGEEAIEFLQTGDTRPDIIFMDVMMGGIDGLTATQRIKADPALSNIPVIICTGNDTEEDKSKAVSAGAITALTKPPVAEILAKILSDVERMTPVVEQAAPVKPQDEPSINEGALVASILATVEKSLLPKIKQEVREIAEDISHQIAGDMAENLIEEHVDSHLRAVLEGLTDKLKIKTEQLAEKTAKQTCTVLVQEMAIDAASQAVQVVVDEADITGQVTLFLSEKGEEWLGDQEEDLGTQLSAQLEQLIPPICTEYLAANLTEIVLPIVKDNASAPVPVIESKVNVAEQGPARNEIENMINLSLHQHTNTVINPIVNSMVNKQLAAQSLLEQDEESIDQLTEQVAMLKKFTVGLAVVVVGLLIAVIV